MAYSQAEELDYTTRLATSFCSFVDLCFGLKASTPLEVVGAAFEGCSGDAEVFADELRRALDDPVTSRRSTVSFKLCIQEFDGDPWTFARSHPFFDGLLPEDHELYGEAGNIRLVSKIARVLLTDAEEHGPIAEYGGPLPGFYDRSFEYVAVGSIPTCVVRVLEWCSKGGGALKDMAGAINDRGSMIETLVSKADPSAYAGIFMHGPCGPLPRLMSHLTDVCSESSSEPLAWVKDFVVNGGRLVLLLKASEASNNAEEPYRKALVDACLVEKVVSLPPRLMPGRPFPMVLLALGSPAEEGVAMYDLTDGGKLIPSGQRRGIRLNPSLLDTGRVQAALDERKKVRSQKAIETHSYSFIPSAYSSEETGASWATLGEKGFEVIRGVPIAKGGAPADILECRYVTIGDLENGSVNVYSPNVYSPKEHSLQRGFEKGIVFQGDVLVSKSYPFRIAYVDGGAEDAVVSSNIFILREPRKSEISPMYLAAFLSSKWGQEALLLQAGQGSIRNLSKSGLEKVRIPVVDASLQERVCDEYRCAREEAKQCQEALQQAQKKMHEAFSKAYEDNQ